MIDSCEDTPRMPDVYTKTLLDIIIYLAETPLFFIDLGASHFFQVYASFGGWGECVSCFMKKDSGFEILGWRSRFPSTGCKKIQV